MMTRPVMTRRVRRWSMIPNDTGLWSEGSGGLALVAREGDAAPGAGAAVFDQFVASVINSAGEAVFMADLRTGATGPVVDGSNNRGLWS